MTKDTSFFFSRAEADHLTGFAVEKHGDHDLWEIPDRTSGEITRPVHASEFGKADREADAYLVDVLWDNSDFGTVLTYSRHDLASETSMSPDHYLQEVNNQEQER